MPKNNYTATTEMCRVLSLEFTVKLAYVVSLITSFRFLIHTVYFQKLD
jgi:hypothetical protein